MSDKRRFTRLNSNLIVRIRGRRPTSTETQALESRIINISKGGVFIETPTPFEQGSLVELDFNIPRCAENVRTRGVVRWSGRAAGGAIGMGIEFLEVTIPSRDALRGYICDRMRAETLTELTAPALRAQFLRFHAGRVGKKLSLEILGRLLSAPLEEIIEAVGVFEDAGLVRTAQDEVHFLSGEDEDLRSAILEWIAANPGPEGE